MEINGKEVSESVESFIRAAVISYMEDIENTPIGAKMRRDKEILEFLRDNCIEKIRTEFYLASKDMVCPTCNTPLNNECPDMICFECNRSIEFISEKKDNHKNFCSETCTETSMENCRHYNNKKEEEE